MRYKILLIDDDKEICDLWRCCLTDLGYLCEVAHSVDRCIDFLKSSEFDLIISDFEIGTDRATQIIEFIDRHALKVPIFICTGRPELARKWTRHSGVPIFDKVDWELIQNLIGTLFSVKSSSSLFE